MYCIYEHGIILNGWEFVLIKAVFSKEILILVYRAAFNMESSQCLSKHAAVIGVAPVKLM